MSEVNITCIRFVRPLTRRKLTVEGREADLQQLRDLGGLVPAASSLRAVSSLSGVSADFRLLPIPPFLRAAANPAIVRSFINSRSISATEASIWNRSRPEAVDVSKPSVRDRKSIFRAERSAVSVIRPPIARPSRSSFQTTIQSPARAKRRASASPGRSPSPR